MLGSVALVRIDVIVNVFPNSLIPFTLMMVAISSSETLDLAKATQHNLPENGNHQENVNLYV
jgi:hypothetical protein